MSFVPALIVVDMQHDFCSPQGSLSAPGALNIVPLINKLLASKAFKYKVASKDWHPQSHISFASNHPPPNNKPFESYVEMSNLVANKPDQKMQQRLWPVHCVQGTEGAELVPELDKDKIDLVVEKGTDERVEMYSALADCFGNLTAGKGGVSHDVAQILREQGITHVYCVGVAGNYCVKYTALDAAKAGFNTYVIAEAQRCLDKSAWLDAQEEYREGHVEVVSVKDEQVQRLFAE